MDATVDRGHLRPGATQGESVGPDHDKPGINTWSDQDRVSLGRNVVGKLDRRAWSDAAVPHVHTRRSNKARDACAYAVPVTVAEIANIAANVYRGRPGTSGR